MRKNSIWLWARICSVAALALFCWACLGAGQTPQDDSFPRLLPSYANNPQQSLSEVLRTRIEAEPFNAVATGIFFIAILHTFLTPVFLRWAHRVEREHSGRLKTNAAGKRKDEVSFKAQILHFLGEVEAVFGIWVVPLLIAIAWFKGWGQAENYLNHDRDFTEPLFVVVIMTMASSRPILKLAERLMAIVAGFGGSTPAAWWLAILTIGPLLGSFITEPAAMTISALLLAEKFYDRRPSSKLAYATLGLLFVNVSVGGTLTHFAAPPVLMVAGKWDWGIKEMLLQFGWKAALGIVVANGWFFVRFRNELNRLRSAKPPVESEMTHHAADKQDPIPFWITAVHLLFLFWTVANNHSRVFFMGGFLFYLAFSQATQHHQFELRLRSPLLVGFFLAGLVVHGGLQGWWIEPVLTRLTEIPLFVGATILTAFNDNAAITYLASLVPNFTDELKYAVVAGAVAGGGLTVIANAPNPAGQSILSAYFPDGVSPLRLFLGALLPTIIVAACFVIFR